MGTFKIKPSHVRIINLYKPAHRILLLWEVKSGSLNIIVLPMSVMVWDVLLSTNTGHKRKLFHRGFDFKRRYQVED